MRIAKSQSLTPICVMNQKANDDMQLAKAIRDAGLGVNAFPTDKDNSNLAFSKYIHAALAKYCGTP
ncbi:MAG: hypothetical protein QOG23_2714 [Blastocatellia bacterium]|jgi:hypothetical protein|nr:hypothetical protein [Blastocatellia bacterium]